MKTFLPLALVTLLLTTSALGQSTSEKFKGDFEGKFAYASNRLVALAEATPEELFSWKPMEGAMSMEKVYLHIARYNYLYPELNMGMPAPDDVDLDTMEDLAGKEHVLKHLEASIAHVKELVAGMDAESLEKATRLYGNDMENWGVLFQLITHMSEHTGQVVAYARMNEIVPPWSR